jgi:hypothetical protein
MRGKKRKRRVKKRMKRMEKLHHRVATLVRE